MLIDEPNVNNDLAKYLPLHVLKSNFIKHACKLSKTSISTRHRDRDCLIVVFSLSHKISINYSQFSHN